MWGIFHIKPVVPQNVVMNENDVMSHTSPVEFEKEPVEVQDFEKITNLGIFRTYLRLLKRNHKITSCNPVGFGSTRILTDFA